MPRLRSAPSSTPAASGDALELREIVEWLCVALMLGPTPAREAAARCEVLLADVEREPILEPTVLSVLANVEAMQGHEMRALELLARWRHAVEELGDTVWLSAINFGFVTLADDPVAAERELRPGYDALRKIGEKSHFSSVAGSLARAVCAQGRYKEPTDSAARASRRLVPTTSTRTSSGGQCAPPCSRTAGSRRRGEARARGRRIRRRERFPRLAR